MTAIRIDDEKYGTMVEFATPECSHASAKYPPRLGYKKLLQMLPHFEDGSVRALLAEICPADLAELDGTATPAEPTPQPTPAPAPVPVAEVAADEDVPF